MLHKRRNLPSHLFHPHSYAFCYVTKTNNRTYNPTMINSLFLHYIQFTSLHNSIKQEQLKTQLPTNSTYLNKSQGKIPKIVSLHKKNGGAMQCECVLVRKLVHQINLYNHFDYAYWLATQLIPHQLCH